MADEMNSLETEVAETEGVVESAILTLQRLSAMITAAGTDPVKLKALTDRLNAKGNALAEAIAATPQ